MPINLESELGLREKRIFLPLQNSYLFQRKSPRKAHIAHRSVTLTPDLRWDREQTTTVVAWRQPSAEAFGCNLAVVRGGCIVSCPALPSFALQPLRIYLEPTHWAVKCTWQHSLVRIMVHKTKQCVCAAARHNIPVLATLLLRDTGTGIKHQNT